jgi:hypothetical protein
MRIGRRRASRQPGDRMRARTHGGSRDVAGDVMPRVPCPSPRIWRASSDAAARAILAILLPLPSTSRAARRTRPPALVLSPGDVGAACQDSADRSFGTASEACPQEKRWEDPRSDLRPCIRVSLPCRPQFAGRNARKGATGSVGVAAGRMSARALVPTSCIYATALWITIAVSSTTRHHAIFCSSTGCKYNTESCILSSTCRFFMVCAVARFC